MSVRLRFAALADHENKDHNDRQQHHCRGYHEHDIVCDECLKGGDGTLHILGGEQIDGAKIQIIIFYAESSEHIALFDRRFHLVDAGDLGVQQAFVVIIREIVSFLPPRTYLTSTEARLSVGLNSVCSPRFSNAQS